eukprot:792865-Amphidinium_carterae.1
MKDRTPMMATPYHAIALAMAVTDFVRRRSVGSIYTLPSISHDVLHNFGVLQVEYVKCICGSLGSALLVFFPKARLFKHTHRLPLYCTRETLCSQSRGLMLAGYTIALNLVGASSAWTTIAPQLRT